MNPIPSSTEKEKFEYLTYRGYILERNTKRTSSPCYSYGCEIGSDSETIFNAKVLICSKHPTDNTHYILLLKNGYSLCSERFDQYSCTITCEFPSGESFTCKHDYDYEKYPNRTRDDWKSLEKLANSLTHELGYTFEEMEAKDSMQMAQNLVLRLRDSV